MIRPDRSLPEVVLYREPADRRKGSNVLSIIVQEEMGRHTGSGEVYVFCNRHRARI